MFGQLEEEIQPDCKWSLRVKNVLHSGKSDFQSVELVETDTYGKVRMAFQHSHHHISS